MLNMPTYNRFLWIVPTLVPIKVPPCYLTDAKKQYGKNTETIETIASGLCEAIVSVNPYDDLPKNTCNVAEDNTISYAQQKQTKQLKQLKQVNKTFETLLMSADYTYAQLQRILKEYKNILAKSPVSSDSDWEHM